MLAKIDPVCLERRVAFSISSPRNHRGDVREPSPSILSAIFQRLGEETRTAAANVAPESAGTRRPMSNPRPRRPVTVHSPILRGFIGASPACATRP